MTKAYVITSGYKDEQVIWGVLITPTRANELFLDVTKRIMDDYIELQYSEDIDPEKYVNKELHRAGYSTIKFYKTDRIWLGE